MIGEYRRIREPVSAVQNRGTLASKQNIVFLLRGIAIVADGYDGGEDGVSVPCLHIIYRFVDPDGGWGLADKEARKDDWVILETDDSNRPQIFVVSNNYFVKNYEAIPGTEVRE